MWKIDTEEWGGRNCVLLFKNFLYIRKNEHAKGVPLFFISHMPKRIWSTARVGPLCLTRNIDEEKTVRLSLYLLLFSSFLNAATTHEGTPNKKIRFETPRRIEKEEVVGDDNEEVLNDGEKGREWVRKQTKKNKTEPMPTCPTAISSGKRRDNFYKYIVRTHATKQDHGLHTPPKVSGFGFPFKRDRIQHYVAKAIQ